MFTGRYEPIPASGQLITPTTGESMTSTFKADYQTPFLLTPGMEQDKRLELAQRAAALKSESERGDQGYIQKGMNWLAGMTGSILNPYSLLTGEAAGVIAKPIISRGAGLVGRYIPSEASAFLQRPLTEQLGANLPEFVGRESVGSLAVKAVSGYAQATGFSLPEEIASTYQPESDAFNWYGGIKASAADGGFGLALMASPYLAGTLWGKLFRGAADHSKMPLPGEKVEGFSESHIDDAVNKAQLTPEQGQWFKDYVFKNDSPENLSTRATQMLIKDGHPVDASTNQVMFKILHPDNVDNYQTAVADSLANNLPENVKGLYKDFIGHARMDELRENSNMIDGLRGVVSFIRKRLDQTPEALINFNKIVRKLLPENLKEENPFTQYKIYKREGKDGRPSMTIPLQVERKLNQDKKINDIKLKVKNYENEYQKTGKMKFKKLADKNRSLLNQPELHENEIDLKKFKIEESSQEPYVAIKSEHGRINLRLYKDKSARVTGVKIPEFNGKFSRGKGHGKALYIAAIKYARSKGLKFYSDVEVSQDAMHIYSALERMGYKFIKNETTHLVQQPGLRRSYYTVTNKKPIFELKSSPEKFQKLLSHKEEIQYLRDTLMPGGKVVDNFKATREYRRLLDLTRVRNDARALMHELHLKNEYALHEAYATVLDTITKVMRSEFGKLAKPENINDYMRERIEAAAPQFKDLEIKAVKDEVRESRSKLQKARESEKTPEGRDREIKTLNEEMKESENKETAKEYQEVKSQMDEFKDNQNVFSSLIKCILGAAHG